MKDSSISPVSIIVPVYKVEKYLERCVESLLSQSMNEIEIILVDDGSPDRCGLICDKYAGRDKRIHVIHQENRGLSAARNAGIEIASGKYLMFVDSDDWVESDFCRIPYELAERYRADLVIFEYYSVNAWRQHKLCNETDGVKSRDQIMNLLDIEIAGDAWNKLYHRDLFKSVRFPEGRNYENGAVTHWIINNSRRIYYTSKVLYNYCSREGSITTLRTHKSSLDRFEINFQKAKDLKQLGYSKKATSTMQGACFSYLIAEGRKSEYSSECLMYFHSIKGFPTNFDWKRKVMLSLLRKSPILFDTVCIITGKRVRSGSG